MTEPQTAPDRDGRRGADRCQRRRNVKVFASKGEQPPAYLRAASTRLEIAVSALTQLNVRALAALDPCSPARTASHQASDSGLVGGSGSVDGGRKI